VLDGSDNEGENISEYFSITDNTPPSVELSTPETAVTGQNTAISWSASDNTGLESHHLFLSSDNGESFVFIDSTLGDISSYNWQVPDSLVCNDCRFKIITYDLVRLSAEDISETFMIEDGIPPEVVVTAPVAGSSIPEYEELTVTWDATDNIEVSDSVRVYYSNDGTSFTEMDSSSFTVPAGVTDNAQIRVVVLDGSDNEGENISEYFSITDNTPPIVEITSPAVGDEFTIGESAAITWSEEDNIGITDRQFAWSVDGEWTDIVPDSTLGTTIWFQIPNEPTDNFSVRTIVSDAVGLSDTSIVSGVGVVIEYPVLVSYTPMETYTPLTMDNIQLEFSVAMDPATISNISLSSALFGNIAYTQGGTTSSFNLAFSQSMASLDTLTLTLPVSLQSSYGYGFDSNADGTTGDSKTIPFYLETLADYDHNEAIDFDDLTTFITAWYADDYSKELGPFTGDVPHLIPELDSSFAFEDIAAFILMWNWSHDFTTRMARMEEVGTPTTFIIANDILSLDLSVFEEDIAAMRIQLNTFHSIIHVISEGMEYEFDISLPRRWEEDNLYEWNFGNPTGKDIENVNICRFETELSHNQDMLIDYEIISSDGVTLSSGSTMVKYIPIPDDFALHQAYPNPFNPVTTIQYALPEDIHVELIIYDILGRQVTELVSTMQQAGYHKVVWNGNNNASGLYIIKMAAGDFISTQKLMLVK
jgi:hypothetical protein